MTGLEVMAAMIRNVPDGHRGQRSMSIAKTRLSKRAHPHREDAGLAAALRL